MQNMLKEKLWAYIVHHNPELMFSLQEEYSVTRYLEEKVREVMPMAETLLSQHKPLYVIEELCVKEMTEELRPSRYLYIRGVIEDEFPQDYERLRENGILTYEIVNLIQACAEIFEAFGFSEKNEEQRHLRHAVIAQLHDYLQ